MHSRRQNRGQNRGERIVDETSDFFHDTRKYEAARIQQEKPFRPALPKPQVPAAGYNNGDRAGTAA
jgi:hypothetical protein